MQDQSYLIQPVNMSYVQNEAGACAETWLSGGHGVRLYMFLSQIGTHSSIPFLESLTVNDVICRRTFHIQ